MDSDQDNRILNYRITIQKLEEELALYRNGTTNQQLIEFIAEKDSEIEAQKNKFIELTENYRKLAKSSRDVLLRCDSLQKENIIAAETNAYLKERMRISEEEVEGLIRRNGHLESEKIKLDETCADSSMKLTHLGKELSDRNDNIDKLQQRCAALVSEKTEKSKQVEKEKSERTRQVKELRDELSRMTRLNTDLNQQLGQIQGDNLELSDKLRDSQVAIAELKRNLGNVQKAAEIERSKADEHRNSSEQRLSTYEADLSDARNRITALSAKCSSLEESLRSKHSEYSLAVAMRDDKVSDCNREISELQAQIRHLQLRQEDEIRAFEDRRKSEMGRLMEMNNTMQLRLQRSEEEKESNSVRKREYDTAQQRIVELENRIKSQDLFFKKRLLGDRTNVLPSTAHEAENRVNGGQMRSFSPSMRSASPRLGNITNGVLSVSASSGPAPSLPLPPPSSANRLSNSRR
eukprot:gene4672-9264_t